MWVGADIAPSMLEVALEKDVEGDLLLQDMGDGLPFRPGAFDGAVSISAVQWLCNADKAHHVPRKRMRRFFRSLYNCLCKGGRAALQARLPCPVCTRSHSTCLTCPLPPRTTRAACRSTPRTCRRRRCSRRRR